MSTIKATNFSHPSAANPAIVLDAAGGATVAGMGLVLVSPTSIANSGGSASASGGAVTFTGVSSVSLNGVFTSTYENYRIVVGLSSSGAGAINIRVRKSGTDNTAANYELQNTTLNNTTLTGGRSTGQTTYPLMTNAGFAQPHFQTVVEIGSPNLSTRTTLQNLANYRIAAGAINAVVSGYHDVVDTFDGFTIYADPSTTITGTLRVYGYKNS